MRHLIILLVITVACLRASDTSAKARVRFDDHVLALAVEGENPGESVREYIPEGETLESWSRLASIRKYPNLEDPKAVATNLLRVLKQQNPQAPSSMIQNPSTGDVIVDFVTWPPDESFAEFNVFRYSKAPAGGLVAHQYAIREYKDTITFMKQLRPLRQRLVDLMAKSGLEMVQ